MHIKPNQFFFLPELKEGGVRNLCRKLPSTRQRIAAQVGMRCLKNKRGEMAEQGLTASVRAESPRFTRRISSSSTTQAGALALFSPQLVLSIKPGQCFLCFRSLTTEVEAFYVATSYCFCSPGTERRAHSHVRQALPLSHHLSPLTILYFETWSQDVAQAGLEFVQWLSLVFSLYSCHPGNQE